RNANAQGDAVTHIPPLARICGSYRVALVPALVPGLGRLPVRLHVHCEQALEAVDGCAGAEQRDTGWQVGREVDVEEGKACPALTDDQLAIDSELQGLQLELNVATEALRPAVFVREESHLALETERSGHTQGNTDSIQLHSWRVSYRVLDK